VKICKHKYLRLLVIELNKREINTLKSAIKICEEGNQLNLKIDTNIDNKFRKARTCLNKILENK